MNTLIVFAHPEPKSFNGQAKDALQSFLQAEGHAVQVSDLFAENFKAAADRQDFPSYREDFFDLQMAQQQSHLLGKVPVDVQREQDKLRWADLIVFQFPMWWYSVPAPLKGYIDRVLSVGFAYGGANQLMGKKALISTSTGAPEFAWTPARKGTIAQILFPITHGTFNLVGLEVLEPFVAYGAKRMSASERQAAIQTLQNRVHTIVAA